MEFHAYLSFKGNCREAFDFYHACLGGEITMAQTYADTPMKDQTPPEMHGQMVHERLVTHGATLMGSDSPPDRYSKPQGFTVSIGIDEPAEADRIFAALSDGGTVSMPIQQTFWAKRFGMFEDKFGIPWMVNCE